MQFPHYDLDLEAIEGGFMVRRRDTSQTYVKGFDSWIPENEFEMNHISPEQAILTELEIVMLFESDELNRTVFTLHWPNTK